jgi:hypothetical protein
VVGEYVGGLGGEIFGGAVLKVGATPPPGLSAEGGIVSDDGPGGPKPGGGATPLPDFDPEGRDRLWRDRPEVEKAGGVATGLVETSAIATALEMALSRALWLNEQVVAMPVRPFQATFTQTVTSSSWKLWWIRPLENRRVVWLLR